MAAMFPVALDLSHLPVAVIGNTDPAAKRVAQLIVAGASDLVVYADAPCEAMVEAAGERLVRRLPSAAALSGVRVLFLVDLTRETADYYCDAARSQGILLNHEDVVPDCEFHSMSQVRRGDLVLAISTAGKSPGLSVRLRQYLEQTFGPEWGQHLETLARQRLMWRDTCADMKTVMRHTTAEIDRRGLMPDVGTPKGLEAAS